jgi:hypothetical protein
VRSGYKDTYGNDDSEFENQLINNLSEFIQTEGSAPWVQSSSEMSLDGRMTVMGTLGRNFASNLSSLPLSGSARALPAHCSTDSLEVSPLQVCSMSNFLWLHKTSKFFSVFLG